MKTNEQIYAKVMQMYGQADMYSSKYMHLSQDAKNDGNDDEYADNNEMYIWFLGQRHALQKLIDYINPDLEEGEENMKKTNVYETMMNDLVDKEVQISSLRAATDAIQILINRLKAGEIDQTEMICKAEGALAAARTAQYYTVKRGDFD